MAHVPLKKYEFLRWNIGKGLFILGIFLFHGCRTTSGRDRTALVVKIERGDTANSLAQKYDTTVSRILRLNGLKSIAELYVGQIIRIEPGPHGGVIGDEPLGGKRSSLTSKGKEDGLRTTLPSTLKSEIAKPEEFTEEDFPQMDTLSPDAGKNKHKESQSDDKSKGFLFKHPKVSKHKSAENKNLRWTWPVFGRLVSWYGPRGDRFHHGVDVEAPLGVGVTASAPGRVLFAGQKSGYGQTVVVDHGRYQTLYGHLSIISVEPGDRVDTFRILGEVGDTGNASGPHLHFEVRAIDGKSLNPLSMLRLPMHVAGSFD